MAAGAEGHREEKPSFHFSDILAIAADGRPRSGRRFPLRVYKHSGQIVRRNKLIAEDEDSHSRMAWMKPHQTRFYSCGHKFAFERFLRIESPFISIRWAL
jgi:hypothetical protein